MRTYLLLPALALTLTAFMAFTHLGNPAITAAQDADAAKAKAFAAFVKLFPATTLPYNLTAEELNKSWERPAKQSATPIARITDTYESFMPEMNRGRFSRSGPDAFEAVALLARGKDKVVVVFKRRHAWSPTGNYYLATYTTQGTRIASESIAGCDGRSVVRACTVTETNGVLNIITRTYRTASNDDNATNAVTSTTPKPELVETAYASVSTKGSIDKVQRP